MAEAVPSTINRADLIKALKINGMTTGEAREIATLANEISQLEPKQQLIRARDLDEEHIGMQIDFGEKHGVLNDVELKRRGVGTLLRGAQYPVNQFADEDEQPEHVGLSYPPRQAAITVVINSKLTRLPASKLVKLTETRDL